MIQALVDAVNRVPALMHLVAEEPVACDFLFVFDIFLESMRENHVVNPLERIPSDPRTLLNQFEIILQRSFPIQFLIFLCALQICECAENVYGLFLLLHIFTFVLTSAPPSRGLRLPLHLCCARGEK